MWYITVQLEVLVIRHRLVSLACAIATVDQAGPGVGDALGLTTKHHILTTNQTRAQPARGSKIQREGGDLVWKLADQTVQLRAKAYGAHSDKAKTRVATIGLES